MNHKKNIETEVEKTLEALDNHRRIQPSPFIFTKIKARIEARQTKSRIGTGWQAALIAPFVIVTGISIGVIIGQNISKSTRLPEKNPFAIYYGLEPLNSTAYVLSEIDR
jgi:hypothetical protein